MGVDLDALAYNVEQLKAFAAPSKFMAVIKANAYGHGLIPCAKHLETVGVDYLGVALIEEGIELRQAGIKTPILVFGGIFGAQIKYFLENDLELTASSVDKLDAIEKVASELGIRAKVHLKIDTGMERVGVHHYSATKLYEAATKLKHSEIKGIFSHFATADEKDSSFVETQISRFRETCREFESIVQSDALFHISNSAGMLTTKSAHMGMVRPGLSIYGVYPAPHFQSVPDLEPVMKLSSRVVYFKVVKEGAGVSYGHKWVAPKDTRVVTVPLGYGDGFFRSLSNKGEVLIRGKRHPIIGSVCMDQIMVDIGQSEAYNGDEVVLIGSQEKEQIRVGEIAELVDTCPHQVLTSTNLRVPRQYQLGSKTLLEKDFY